MHILLVSATHLESNILKDVLGLEKTNMEIDVFCNKDSIYKTELLVTGIGQVNLAYALGHYFAKRKPDWAICFGIAGAFHAKYSLGQVVEIEKDTFADIGFEDGDKILGLKEVGFFLGVKQSEKWYDELKNPDAGISGLPLVMGLTVNTVSGSESTINRLLNRFSRTDVETMENASFFHACRLSGIRHTALRGLSNYVEPRDRSRWQIKQSVENVQKEVTVLIDKLKSHCLPHEPFQ